MERSLPKVACRQFLPSFNDWLDVCIIQLFRSDFSRRAISWPRLIAVTWGGVAIDTSAVVLDCLSDSSLSQCLQASCKQCLLESICIPMFGTWSMLNGEVIVGGVRSNMQLDPQVAGNSRANEGLHGQF